MSFRLFQVIFLCLLSFSSVWAKSIKVMSYNVENLFDAKHDSGKDDWTFMPLANPEKVENCEKVTVDHYKKECLETDWTPSKVEIKLNQIVKVVKSVGELPDMLALVEVENKYVVDQLRRKLGYKNLIITNSPDIRGVDVALLYNNSADLKYVSSKEHKLAVSGSGIKSPTRNILEVNFQVASKPFSIFVNHWPSQQSGPNSRNSVANQLLEILKLRLNDASSKIMLVGDFNVIDTEKPNPMTDVLTKNTGLTDIYTKLTKVQKSKLPLGTYFYGWDFTWNRLDRVIVSKGLLTGSPSVDPKTLTVHHPDFLNREYVQKNPERPHAGEKAIVPWKYWPNAYMQDRAGFSDHYPIEVMIDI
jgi:endonuclease/exonuclease/phosphatase family metal-dependent hydrolase